MRNRRHSVLSAAICSFLLSGCANVRPTQELKIGNPTSFSQDNPKAQAGDLDAMVTTAQDYIAGNGTAVDYAMAMQWL
jgi:hypothetical protein